VRWLGNLDVGFGFITGRWWAWKLGILALEVFHHPLYLQVVLIFFRALKQL